MQWKNNLVKIVLVLVLSLLCTTRVCAQENNVTYDENANKNQQVGIPGFEQSTKDNVLEDTEQGKDDSTEVPENPDVPSEPEEEPEEEPSRLEKDTAAWDMAAINTIQITRGKTTTYQLKIYNIPEETSEYTIKWTTNNKKIATVDKNGKVKMIAKGNAIITCTVQTQAGYSRSFTCKVTVSEPKFKKSTYVIAKSTPLRLEIAGTKTTSFKISGNRSDLLTVYQSDKGMVKGKKEGTATVTVNIDGVAIKCKVVITNPKLKKKLFVMTKDQTDQITAMNLSKSSKVTYQSKHPKIATVSSKGKIKTLKTGVAVILVTIDQKEFEVTVSVGKTKAVQAIKNAQKVLGATYSQPYRMKKGYYDCSSLVWRTYMPTGITFGYSKKASNAPTAAGEAYYLVSKKKEIAKKYVDEKLLKPGDLIFISNKKNGRFRNITHVAIYIGNDKIIHASPLNNAGVQYGSYSYYKKMIVSIGRPA